MTSHSSRYLQAGLVATNCIRTHQYAVVKNSHRLGSKINFWTNGPLDRKTLFGKHWGHQKDNHISKSSHHDFQILVILMTGCLLISVIFNIYIFYLQLKYSLALVLVYDCLFGQGLKCGGKFKQIITRNKSSLNAALARMKIKAKVTSNEELLPEKSTVAGI